MKRTLTITVIALAMLIATPANAKKPPKPEPPTDPPPIERCVFDDTGALGTFDGTNPYRCQWTVTDRDSEHTFEMRPITPTAERVLGPYLAVTDIYPHGGDICFASHQSGWHDLQSYAEPNSATRWSVPLPANGDCADDNNVPDTDGPETFALTVSAQKVRHGTVQLVWTNATP